MAKIKQMTKQPYTEVPYISPEDVEAPAESKASVQKWEASQHGGWYFGDTMAKKILGIVVAVLVVYLLYLGYQRYKESSASENGAIHSEDSGSTRSSKDDSSSDDAPPPRIQPRITYNQPQPAPIQQQPVMQTMAAPASDSIDPNPPNGMAFAGTGKFQVYRQGNLTWRVDTETGHTCIVFATMEEWRKPIVYQHGCNNS